MSTELWVTSGSITGGANGETSRHLWSFEGKPMEMPATRYGVGIPIHLRRWQLRTKGGGGGAGRTGPCLTCVPHGLRSFDMVPA